MSYVGRIRKTTSGAWQPVGSTLYGTCGTAAGTAAKVVTCDNFDALITGVTIHVKMTNANTAASPTLNVNGTGAKSVRFISGIAECYWSAGEVISFTYDGTNWLANDSTQIVYDQETIDFSTTLQSGTSDIPILTKKLLTYKTQGQAIAYVDVSFQANATGSRLVRFVKYNSDGTVSSYGLMQCVAAAPTGNTRLTDTIIHTVTAGQTLGIQAYQDSGSSMTVQSFGWARVFPHDRIITLP